MTLEMFWKAYRLAKRHGLELTAPAGEFGLPWLNVETAIDLLEVDRIDHGYTVIDNPALSRRPLPISSLTKDLQAFSLANRRVSRR